MRTTKFEYTGYSSRNYFDNNTITVRLGTPNLENGHSLYHEFGHVLEQPSGYQLYGVAKVLSKNERLDQLALQFDEQTNPCGRFTASREYFFRYWPVSSRNRLFFA